MERPFRIWDDQLLRNMPRRSYNTEEAAKEKCAALMLWLPIGSTLTVYDVSRGKWCMTLTRKISGIYFDKEKINGQFVK